MHKLFEKNDVKEAAILTAYNPKSVETDISINKEQNLELEKKLVSENFSFIPAEGVCPNNKWPGEKSFLVFGMSLASAKDYGHQFNQNAIVWVRWNKDSSIDFVKVNYGFS